MSLFLEFEYIDSNNAGRKTGVGCEGETDHETRKLFESARKFSVPIETCTFLLDLREDNRDILDTIGISKDGFETLTGQKPMTNEEYVELDTQFWQSIRRMMEEDAPDMLIAS